MLQSLAKSTQEQYNTVYKNWWSYCTEKDINCYKADVPEVLSFLKLQYDRKDFKYGTFNTYRSALSLILPGNIGQNIQIRRFLRGISRLRPQRYKYNVTWDPDGVLKWLGSKYPNNFLPFEVLSRKLITLLALITGHRLQTLSLIKVENVIISDEGVQIYIDERTKTSKVGGEQPCLKLPYFLENPNICVASLFCEYVERTATLRTFSQEFLFITLRPPHGRAKIDTLRRWVKETLLAAGIDTRIFSVHSTRHASTSKAFRRGISIETIRKTVGWSDNSRVFAEFYNRPLDQTFSFAKAVMA